MLERDRITLDFKGLNTYADVFHKNLPEVVAEYDSLRGYLSASPSSGPGVVPDLFNGDEHYWGVWRGKEPFEKYVTHIARFMSEYGFQSFPEISTVRKYVIPEDYDIFISWNSEVLAKNIYFQIADEERFFNDNYFDLLPGETKTVTLFTKIPETKLKEILTLRTLVDAF